MCGLSVNFHLGLGEEKKGRLGRGGGIVTVGTLCCNVRS